MGSDGDAERSRLDEQIAYYRARAPEYDEWFERRGRYDRGPEPNRQWAAELARVRRALLAALPARPGRVLDLACGTGHWTRLLASRAREVVAVDASREMLAINRQRVATGRAPGAAAVRHVQADLFRWQPRARFGFVFMGFWISHVPARRFERFWDRLAGWLDPGGRVFFVDNLRPSDRDVCAPVPRSTHTRRTLNDGRSFEIVKVFYEPAALARRLAERGWSFRVETTAAYFLYASGSYAAGGAEA